MKYSKASVVSNTHKIPELKFEDHDLTSFGGLVLFQKFFAVIGLNDRLRRCFDHLKGGKAYSPAKIILQLIVHILLGFRCLRDRDYYCDDPLVKRLLGLTRIPDVATISRFLGSADAKCVVNLCGLLRKMAIDRLGQLGLPRITLDFDGSVQSTGRFAEGAAVGFNKKKKGARSYYPLFCTIAQTGQVLDFLHRPGNIHDSKGARRFIRACVLAVRKAVPNAVIEVRMDSAFFSDEIVEELDRHGVEFTVSVPFERFGKLKAMVEARKRWRRLNRRTSWFEVLWKPDCWSERFRFVFVRTRRKVRPKGPVQLDLFEPFDWDYEYKVIVTNKTLTMAKAVAYHEGRGTQEGIFAELKSQCQMDYVPTRRLIGNQLYLVVTLLAHNLVRDLQMTIKPPVRRTTQKRSPLWIFEQLDTLRKTILARAGRLTRPQGTLTLTLNANQLVRQRLLQMLEALDQAA